jgi:hypothetical protein
MRVRGGGIPGVAPGATDDVTGPQIGAEGFEGDE